MARIRKARIRLLSAFPFFGHLVISLKVSIVEATDTTTITASVSSDGHLRFNEGFLNTLTDAEVAGVLTHEALHVALLFWARQKHRQAKLYRIADGKRHAVSAWNVAHDYAINILIQDAVPLSAGRIALPKTVLLDEAYRGLPAEDIYDLILKNSEHIDLSGFEEDVTGQNTAGHDDHWRANILRAAQQHQARGMTLPCAIQSVISDMVCPKLTWQNKLEQWVGDNLGKMDFSYRRPSRRAESVGEILCSVVAYGLPQVVVLWDTSGSMSNTETTILAEVLGILEVTGAPIRVVTCDCVVHGDVFTQNADEIIASVQGGGGSDFNPAFQKVLENANPNTVIVAITDGEIDVPDEVPPVQAVLWLLTPSGIDPTKGRWGHVVHMA